MASARIALSMGVLALVSTVWASGGVPIGPESLKIELELEPDPELEQEPAPEFEPEREPQSEDDATVSPSRAPTKAALPTTADSAVGSTAAFISMPPASHPPTLHSPTPPSPTSHIPSAQSPTATVVTKLSTAVPESTSAMSKSSETTTETAVFDSMPAPAGNATPAPEVRITATFEIEGNLSTMSSGDEMRTKTNAQKAFLEASNGAIVKEDIIRIELSQKEYPASRIRRSVLELPTIVVTFTLKEAVGLSTVGAALGSVAAVEVVTDGVTTEAAVSNARMSVLGVASDSTPDSTPGPDVTTTKSRSSSAGTVVAVVIVVLLLVAASIGGGYCFVTHKRIRSTAITSKERRRSSLLEAGELAAAGDNWIAATEALSTFENSQQIPKNSQQMPSFGEAAGPSELTAIPKPQPRDV